MTEARSLTTVDVYIVGIISKANTPFLSPSSHGAPRNSDWLGPLPVTCSSGYFPEMYTKLGKLQSGLVFIAIDKLMCIWKHTYLRESICIHSIYAGLIIKLLCEYCKK
jgi:hypothetical protein